MSPEQHFCALLALRRFSRQQHINAMPHDEFAAMNEILASQLEADNSDETNRLAWFVLTHPFNPDLMRNIGLFDAVPTLSRYDAVLAVCRAITGKPEDSPVSGANCDDYKLKAVA